MTRDVAAMASVYVHESARGPMRSSGREGMGAVGVEGMGMEGMMAEGRGAMVGAGVGMLVWVAGVLDAGGSEEVRWMAPFAVLVSAAVAMGVLRWSWWSGGASEEGEFGL